MRTVFLAAMTMLLAFADANAEYRYRLYLKDKSGSEYCSLSQRALDRRNSQGIPLDEADICVSQEYLSRIAELGYTIVTKSRWLNTVVIMRPDGSKIEDYVINKLSFVERFEQITNSEVIRNANRYDKYHFEKNLPAGSTSNKAPILEVNGQALMNNGFHGAGKLIAVLDGGFTKVDEHECLNRNVIGWYDMYDPDGKTDHIFTVEDHGAKCLSVMSCDSTAGVWGTATEAEYYLIRTEYSANESPLEEDMWVAGAEMADSIGADAISSSLGYFTFDDSLYDHSQTDLTQGVAFISKGAAIAVTRGMLVCCSAGNDRQTAWGTINFPADVQDVLTVGATNSSLNLSSFSSPGFTSPYVKPDVCCRGSSVPAIDPYDGRVCYVSGTSFSTPMMCGLCTSLWSAAPELTPGQIRDIVRQSADRYSQPDSLYGYGLPDFEVALRMALEMTGRGDESAIGNPRAIADFPSRAEDVYYDLTGRKVLKPLEKKAVFVQKSGKKVFLLR